MKIGSYPSNVHTVNRVSEKSDSQDRSQSGGFERHQEQKKEEKEFKVTIESVQQAIESFAADELNQTQGITASPEGAGPGLKILLKDHAGGILRSISGEEFLKLRDAVNSGQRSGRLLDRKA
jgi:hypothetical protein